MSTTAEDDAVLIAIYNDALPNKTKRAAEALPHRSPGGLCTRLSDLRKRGVVPSGGTLMDVRCFMVEQTDRARYHRSIWGRRDDVGMCGGTGGRYAHHVRVFSDAVPLTDEPDWSLAPVLDYPSACGCGYELTEVNSFRSSGFGAEWRRIDTGETAWEPEAFGGGAMYFRRGAHCCFPHDPPCSEHLHVVLPNGMGWDIDSRANNCGRKDDKIRSTTAGRAAAKRRSSTSSVARANAPRAVARSSRATNHGFLGGGPEGPGVLVPA